MVWPVSSSFLLRRVMVICSLLLSLYLNLILGLLLRLLVKLLLLRLRLLCVWWCCSYRLTLLRLLMHNQNNECKMLIVIDK